MLSITKASGLRLRCRRPVSAHSPTPSPPPSFDWDEKTDDLSSQFEQLSLQASTISTPSHRTKGRAKKNEEYDLQAIIRFLNDPSSSKGIEMRYAFQAAFPDWEIVETRSVGGGRGQHYDFQILVAHAETGEQVWWNVEHKGSQKGHYREGLPPWDGGVQFLNAGMEKFSISDEYARFWYERFIVSGRLREEFKIDDDIMTPDYETWRNRDAKIQGDPKTPFGKALKANVRAVLGEKASLLAHRDEFVPLFIKHIQTERPELIDLLKEEILEIAKKTFEQKDVWLQIFGNIDGDFDFKWSPKLDISEITEISFDKNTKTDFTGNVVSDCAYPITFIIRWGKGAGFSNLRVDLK